MFEDYSNVEEVLDRYNLYRTSEDRAFFDKIRILRTEEKAKLHGTDNFFNHFHNGLQLKNEYELERFLDFMYDNKLKISLVESLYNFEIGMKILKGAI